MTWESNEVNGRKQWPFFQEVDLDTVFDGVRSL